MFERRFGIKAYDYWWGYSKAQIELMIADQPFVSYNRKKDVKKTKKSMDALADAWFEKKKKDGSLGITNPLSGFGSAKTTSLKDFFKK